ncbi:MAG: deoxyribonuclease IV [Patescibacteria group bacterium]
MFYIGGHVSASGGLSKTIENAEKIGANAIQFFGSSPRQWRVTKHFGDDIAAFRLALKKSPIKQVFLHAPYLINLASPAEDSRARSRNLLTDHFKIAEAIGAQGLIFHIGSRKGLSKEQAEKIIVRELRETLRGVSGKSFLVIENSAGGGESVGSTLEEIASIMKAVDSGRLMMCLDTAHAFESGMIPGYTEETVKELAGKIKKTVGFHRLVALHVNDSKTVFNSHHDRHENIGKGYIGLEGFQALARHKIFKKKPWILEVPGFDGNGPDKKNVDILKSCFTS